MLIGIQITLFKYTGNKGLYNIPIIEKQITILFISSLILYSLIRIINELTNTTILKI